MRQEKEDKHIQNGVFLSWSQLFKKPQWAAPSTWEVFQIGYVGNICWNGEGYVCFRLSNSFNWSDFLCGKISSAVRAALWGSRTPHLVMWCFWVVAGSLAFKHPVRLDLGSEITAGMRNSKVTFTQRSWEQPEAVRRGGILVRTDFPLGKGHVLGDRWGWTNLTSIAQLCPTLCNPLDCSTPGFPVHHQLLELAQTHIHQVGDAI